MFLDAGAAHMAQAGFARFSARAVAKRVGYSVGTLYNLFGSYDRFIVALNVQTLTAWTEALRARLDRGGSDRIAVLVEGYFDFARANTHAWMALYDHRLPAGAKLPERFDEAFGGLIDLIEAEVARALRAAPDDRTRALAGSLIAIAHGHCTFALNGTYEAFGGDARAAALQRIRESLAAEPLGGRCVVPARRPGMNDPKRPGESPDEMEKQAQESRDALDEVPPPGTDPLHEGP